MKLFYCVSMVMLLMVVCEGTPAPKRSLVTTTTTAWTTTIAGSPINLHGKMATVSVNSGVTFYPSYYNTAEREDRWKTPATAITAIPITKITTTATTPNTTTTTTAKTTANTTTTTTANTTTTTTPKTTANTTTTTTANTTTTTTAKTTANTTTTTTRTTTTPASRGVTVCLRYLADYNTAHIFTLGSSSPLYLTGSPMGTYTLQWNDYYSRQVSVSPISQMWRSVDTQPWFSVCMTLDLNKQVVQIFEGGYMSARKILQPHLMWSVDPVLDVSGFDGQVKDIEVWDYPLAYIRILGYMQNYGPSGNVMTWSNIKYKCYGDALLEEDFSQQQKGPISSSEEKREPISSGERGGQRLRFRKAFNWPRQVL